MARAAAYRDDADDLPRGVYLERYKRHGFRWAFAINAHHVRVLERPILDPSDEDAVVNELWHELDHLDPPTPPDVPGARPLRRAW